MMTVSPSAAWTTGLLSQPSVELHVVFRAKPLDIERSFVIGVMSMNLRRPACLTGLSDELPVFQSVPHRFPGYPRDRALQPGVVEGLCVRDTESVLSGREVCAFPHDADPFHYRRERRVAVPTEAMVMARAIASRPGRLAAQGNETGLPSPVGIEPQILVFLGRVRRALKAAISSPWQKMRIAQAQPAVLLRAFALVDRTRWSGCPPAPSSRVVGHDVIIMDTLK